MEKLKILEEKAIKEATEAAQIIFDKYSIEMSNLIKAKIPAGCKIVQGNGMALLLNSNDEKIKSGRAWGIDASGEDDDFLSYLGSLQYGARLDPYFSIEL